MADSYLYRCALCRHASPAGAEPLCLHPLTARPGRYDLPDTPRTCREARSGWPSARVRRWLGLGRLCGPEASLMEPRRDFAPTADDAESADAAEAGRYVYAPPPPEPPPPAEGLTLVRVFSYGELADVLSIQAAVDAKLTGYALRGAGVTLEVLPPDEQGFKVRVVVRRDEVSRG